MKSCAAAFLLLFIAVSAGDAGDFPTTKSHDIEGAIIPAETVREWSESIRRGRGAPHGIQNIFGVEAESSWTPSAQDVELVETRLKEVLQDALQNPAKLNKYAKTTASRKYLSQQITQILSHYGKYRRQYIGLIIDGNRHVYINSFRSDEGIDFTKQFIAVSDGGFWYWQILYSLDDSRFHQLAINGEA